MRILENTQVEITCKQNTNKLWYSNFQNIGIRATVVRWYSVSQERAGCEALTKSPSPVLTRFAIRRAFP